ncbi:hypothetical protein BVRB_5g121570 [Beta vulgaris subsp. vulgaris]|nr:hypothetical protein BVRB_5g121570 [Beta vulgaris subsp. vulgaris]
MMYGSPVFSGIRFFLSGFNSQNYLQVKSQLVSEGGVVLEEYGTDCTHVVVHDLVYDDPICVTARRDKKVLVTALWVGHSLDAGAPVDAANIMYRPLKELTGIPGANELLICLTGYQGADREDIMMMVRLMGAHFSKPLLANKVTHLICYKFEGEKYELAKKMNYAKLVNHLWLEDCLKAWKILPEESYNISGYELEMMGAEAKDSEDETENFTGRNINGITNLPNDMGETHNQSVVTSKVSVPSTHQGFSNNLIVNDGKSLQSDLLFESGERVHKGQYQMDANSHNADLQNIAFLSSNQIENGYPSTSGKAEISCDTDAEKFNSFKSSGMTEKKSSFQLHIGEGFGDTIKASPKRPLDSDTGNRSPLNSRKTPRSRTPLQTAGKFGKSDERPGEKTAKKIIVDVPTFNLETDSEEAALVSLELSSSKKITESDAVKHSTLKSKKYLRRSSLSKSAGKSSDADGKLKKGSAEKVVDVCTSNVGPDQGKATSACAASSGEAGIIDGEVPGGLLPRKRTADGSTISHATPKSQKLATSASEKVDAAEARTPVDSALEERKSDALSSGNHIGDEFTSPSAGSKPLTADVLTSPIPNSVSTSPCVGNKKGQPQNLHQNVAASPGTNDIEAVKSGGPELKSGDQTGNSIAKPARKKMVARKTLGSRPKVSKRSADARKSSVSENPLQDETAIQSVAQQNKKELTPSPDTDKVLVLPITVDGPVGFSSKLHLEFGTEIFDGAEVSDDLTKAPPKLDVHSKKPVIAEQSHKVESITGGASGGLLHQADGAEVTSDSDKTNEQGTFVVETVGVKGNLVPQKKGIAVKAKKKIAAKEAVKNADEIKGGEGSNRVKKQVVGVAAKKGRGTLLLEKSKRPVEVGKENELVRNDRVELGSENELVCNDQHTNKVVKHSGKLASKKRRGTLLLNKSEGSVEAETENEQVFDGDGQNNVTSSLGDLTATSNMAQDYEEAKNKNDPCVLNDQGTSKVVKCPGKLTGKKRRGTLMLKKPDSPDEAEKEIEPVVDGKQDHGKLAGVSGISGRSKETEKENDIPILGTNQGKIKGGKHAGNLAAKKRRGTLVLSKSEAQVDEEKKIKKVSDIDEDKSKGGILTEKLAKSNLTANRSDVANSNSLDIQEVKKQPACFLLSGHRLQRKEFQQLIKRLKGKVCRDSHQWSYQASHFIVPDPIRRTEKFFAAAASGSWILKTDYLAASSQAGKFLPEEPYEWYKNGLSEDGAISLEAPRKWRLLRERTGHGAFYGMQIVIYGECIAPPLDTLKRVVKAGDGTILATSPPYTRFLESRVDFAIVSPGMPRVDIWIQEFLRHQIPCVLADYLVEYVCKPGYPLDRHVQYNTHEWATKSFSQLMSLSEEVITHAATPPDDQVSDDLACQVCGSTDRGEVMLICGNETGSIGCGTGTHIDCCDPPLEDIPEEDWYCPTCTKSANKPPGSSKNKRSSSRK